MARDRSVRRQLRRLGWKVLTFWEHDLSKEDAVVRRLRRALDASASLS
jgi:G:T-mismatch repair DNA endonuclease (very short patch repair protein)